MIEISKAESDLLLFEIHLDLARCDLTSVNIG